MSLKKMLKRNKKLQAYSSRVMTQARKKGLKVGRPGIAIRSKREVQ